MQTTVGFSHYLLQHPTLLLLLLAHFLADFQFQTEKVAQKKGRDMTYLIYHILVVWAFLAIVFVLQPKAWLAILLIGMSHVLLDYLKPGLTTLLGFSKRSMFYLDQACHLFIIFLVHHFFVQETSSLPQWWNILLFVVLITKPTNIAFKLTFEKYQPQAKGEVDETIAGAGATIGFLERVIMGICILFGQFASIGLVFTAKSIARYNKISEDPAFAEYYLIGSLFSILATLLAAWLCFL